MSLYSKSLLIGLCLSISHFSYAKILHWNAQVPSSLEGFSGSAPELAAITANRIFIYAHPQQRIKLPTFKTNNLQAAQFYSAAIVVPTSTVQIERLLTNYQNYVGLFPTLRSAKVLESAGDIKQVKYQIHIPTPIPVLNFKETVVMQHQLDKNSINTLIINAPIPFAAGKIEWFPIEANKTLVTVTQWGDLNQPQGFLFTKILNALPEAKLGIPAGTNTFLLEAIQQRFKTQSTFTLKPNHLAQPKLDNNDLQKILMLSQRSMQPVSIIMPNHQIREGKSIENMRFSTTYHYYPHTAQNLQPWLAANASQQLFPKQIKQVDLHPISTKNVDAHFRVSVGLGVIQIPFNFNVRFNQISPLHNQYYAIGGDLKNVKGGMKLLAQPTGTLFQMTTSLKIDDQAPFLLRAMRSMPYHDVIPAVSANTVYALKVQQKMQ